MSGFAQTPSLDGDVNRGPALLAIFWVEISLSILFVATRFYVRGVMHAVGADDWTILATLVMYIATLSLCTILVTYGLGRHIYYLTPDQQYQMGRWNWIVQPFGILTLPLGKISVVLLLQRIMSREGRWGRIFLWVNMALFTCVMIVAAIISYAQCNPPSALWDVRVAATATCWNPRIQADWAVFGSAYSAFLDFVLALFPISFIWKLNLSSKKKIFLGILLGIGILSGICASIKTSQAATLGARSDVSWVLFSLYAWSSSEIFINIFCACVPTLKPLYDFILDGVPISDRYSKSGPSSYRGLRSWRSNATSRANGQSSNMTGRSRDAKDVHPSQASDCTIEHHRTRTVEIESSTKLASNYEMV